MFAIAAVTNYHKHSGIKQYKCIISQFWRLEVQNESYLEKKKKIQGISKAVFLLEPPRKSLFSCLFHLLEAAVFLGSWPLHTFKDSNCRILLTSAPVVKSPSLTPTFLSPSSTHKDPCDYTVPIQLIQDNLPSSISLT